MKTTTLALVLCLGFAAAGCNSAEQVQRDPSEAATEQDATAPSPPLAPEEAMAPEAAPVVPEEIAEEDAATPLEAATPEETTPIYSLNGADYFRAHAPAFKIVEKPGAIPLRPFVRQDLSRFMRNIPLNSLPCPNPGETRDDDGNCASGI